MPLLEQVDSTKTIGCEKEVETTPISKPNGKRSSNNVESTVILNVDDGQGSTTKPAKIPCVKVENDA
jgi:hypothetical protein